MMCMYIHIYIYTLYIYIYIYIYIHTHVLYTHNVCYGLTWQHSTKRCACIRCLTSGHPRRRPQRNTYGCRRWQSLRRSANIVGAASYHEISRWAQLDHTFVAVVRVNTYGSCTHTETATCVSKRTAGQSIRNNI